MTMSIASRTNEFELPLDLSEWVESDVWANWVEELVGSLVGQNPELQNFLRANPRFQPRALLSLLLHSYALGRIAIVIFGDILRSEPSERIRM